MSRPRIGQPALGLFAIAIDPKPGRPRISKPAPETSTGRRRIGQGVGQMDIGGWSIVPASEHNGKLLPQYALTGARWAAFAWPYPGALEPSHIERFATREEAAAFAASHPPPKMKHRR